MGVLGSQIKKLICDRYGSIPRLAKQLNMSEQTIYSALNNDVLGSSIVTFMPVARALNLDPYALLDKRVGLMPDEHSGYVDVPLFDSAPPAEPAAADDVQEVFPIPTPLYNRWPQAFLLHIHGNYVNVLVPDGCFALIEPCHEVEVQGDLYAVAAGETHPLMGCAYLLDNGLELRPCSSDPTFRPRIIDFNEPEGRDARILGRVVWYTAPFDWRPFAESEAD